MLAAASTLVSCRQPPLVSAVGDLRFEPRTLELGSLYVGTRAQALVRLVNLGRSPLPLTWELPDGPFGFDPPPGVLPAGALELGVYIEPTQPGPLAATLAVRSGEGHLATVELRAEVLPLPACPTPSSCHRFEFDRAQGRCVEKTLEDGTACDPRSVCVLDATCRQGRCVGTPKSCDDGDACTLDVCNALTGCEAVPAPPCPGDGKCQVGTCDPKTGCGLAPAQDGTSCGQVSCDAAEVCVDGACVVRDPPDGFVCAQASPCQGEGICRGSACERAQATALSSTWTYDSAAGGAEPLGLHDLVMEPDGAVSLMGFFSRPITRANTPFTAQLAHDARRCILWNGQLACADYSQPSISGQVALVRLDGGSATWTFNLGEARPDLAADTDALFLARLAALGSDRLLALYESYPRGSGGRTECRGYFVAIVDTQGGLVSAFKLEDPLLSQCNHPHPFGVASDLVGNFYLALSPSSPGGAPLSATAPTVFLSFTRDGAFRWRRQDAQRGGELAIAHGLLYPEYGTAPRSLVDGELRPFAPRRVSQIGRAVATTQRLVPSPTLAPPWGGGGTLEGLTTQGQSAWTYELPAPDAFLTRELRLVRWRPGPGAEQTEVVLALARKGGVGTLLAVEPSSGREVWACPVDAPVMDAPQLFEVARGKLALMGSALTCGDCDPPFAGSSASFHAFGVPGFEPSASPWPGTFGGAGHDHHEKGYWVAPAQPPAN